MVTYFHYLHFTKKTWLDNHVEKSIVLTWFYLIAK